MCRGYMQVLRHFIGGTGVPMDLGFHRGTGTNSLRVQRDRWTFTVSCNHSYLVLKHLHHPKRKPCTHLAVTPHAPSPAPATTNLLSACGFACSGRCPVNGIPCSVTLGAWLQVPVSPGGKLDSLPGLQQGHCRGPTAWSGAGLKRSP